MEKLNMKMKRSENMEIRVFENKERLNREAATYFKKVMQEKKKPVLGLATGSTPLGMYEKLIEMYENKEISFANTITYNLDEYVGIDKDHEQSYYTFMHKNLFDEVDMKDENIMIPKGIGNPEENCKEYNKLLNENEIDIQVLGIGSNGHIAFNEPGTPFELRTNIVKLKDSTIKDNFGDALDFLTHAVTMGMSDIYGKSNKIILLA
jgi:glucosamine-6-phosphate deaminase